MATARRPRSTSRSAENAPDAIAADELPERNRIYTFYSYKGGTGRSMALANIAWILASNGQRVLVLDWDLEAPGLHRYFRPFLPDPEGLESEGLIDFFSDFAEAARLQHRGALEKKPDAPASTAWHEAYADILRYAVSLDHDFPAPGTLDFVPAGRQGASYGIRVSSFDWTEFYQKLGGGVFLEEVKRRLLADYDFILIDSRTGLSDTSGICTVQMPGELVVFFTLNRQSIFGAAAAAQSAVEQRRTATGESTLRVWPVATRIDTNEMERLEAARTLARETFAPLLQRTVKRDQRQEYWAQAEVPYVPFYAYEEILATIADRPKLTSTLLAAMERLAGALTEGRIKGLVPLPERERNELRTRFLGLPEKAAGPHGAFKFYVSYTRADVPEKAIVNIISSLERQFGAANVFIDRKIPLGRPIWPALQEGLSSADCVLFFIGRRWLDSANTAKELELATVAGKQLVPIIVGRDVSFSDLPPSLADLMGLQLSLGSLDRGIASLVHNLRPFAAPAEAAARTLPPIDPEDPHRGQWGGKPQRNGRKLSATVRPVSKHWFEIQLVVTGTDRDPLEGEVKFHLHPTFDPSVETVPARRGEARLVAHAFGAFTAGAETDGGRTHLELDLAKLPDAPKYFREH